MLMGALKCGVVDENVDAAEFCQRFFTSAWQCSTSPTSPAMSTARRPAFSFTQSRPAAICNRGGFA